METILKNMAIEDVSPTELEGLKFMREEEKLARDVYLVLYETWNANVFSNIAKSEQKHTNAIKTILDKYEIEDPVVNDEIGVFQNSDLQTLYNSLVEKGKVSLVEALKIGAAIEEIDILDLEKYLDEVDSEDITFVYNNLMRGSRNHLRAFVKNLNTQNVSYKAQYLDDEQFQTIVTSEAERGTGRGRGRR
ncbi:MAG: DUF2202 domain-containing protein [Ignavibacteriae bacterium]|nr:DUF2202 domain-containing protein [Ignavibacteriota bacterium]